MPPCDFITLYEIGVGSLAVRHSEITTIELTAECASRITLSNGYSKVVQENPTRILFLINAAQELCKD
jgi:hypothetical protein